uniref:Chemokine interleukin-8-like domain-containing protein n=1 Tax=Pygocentrus nattereri TaxID=42514 RepID=A0A3B4EBJ4_PYGNA
MMVFKPIGDHEQPDHLHLQPCLRKQTRGQLSNSHNMHLSQKSMGSLAVIAVLLCIAIMGANGQQKKSECCKEVSTEKITVPITGFQLQRKNPPCVKAVIFFTNEGPKCSHWRENWVQDKILELRKLQSAEKGQKKDSSMAAP